MDDDFSYLPCCQIASHVPDPLPDGVITTWHAPQGRSERARVRDYTCACMPTFYELCQSGGQYFIRRSRRVGDGVAIEESFPYPRARALDFWARLLEGEPSEPHEPCGEVTGEAVPARHDSTGTTGRAGSRRGARSPSRPGRPKVWLVQAPRRTWASRRLLRLANGRTGRRPGAMI